MLFFSYMVYFMQQVWDFLLSITIPVQIGEYQFASVPVFGVAVFMIFISFAVSMIFRK